MRAALGAAALVAACGVTIAAQPGTRADVGANKDAGRPEISLKVTPLVAFSPARISLRAELKGGQSDYEPFYCTTIQWEWDDGTVSENTPDCSPYEAGVSEIRRFYSNTHTYTQAGRYNVRFRMKKGDRVVGGGSATVQVRPGLREMGEPPL